MMVQGPKCIFTELINKVSLAEKNLRFANRTWLLRKKNIFRNIYIYLICAHIYVKYKYIHIHYTQFEIISIMTEGFNKLINNLVFLVTIAITSSYFFFFFKCF